MGIVETYHQQTRPLVSWREISDGNCPSRMSSWLFEGPQIPLSDQTIWASIDRSLSRSPNDIAIICDGLSVSAVALRLRIEQFDWDAGHRVIGVMMSRSITSVAAILAIWKSNATYVPIAVEYPAEQKEAILNSCKPSLIISDHPLCFHGYHQIDEQTGLDGVVAFLYQRLEWVPGHDPIGSHDVCYIAHTSGSSGRPKSIAIRHAGLINRLDAMQRLFSIRANDRLLYKTPALFDVHIWEFLLPIVSGCTLVIYREDTHFSLFDFARVIYEQRITVIGVVPVVLGLLLKMPEIAASIDLRVVICGGEAWDAQLAREFHAKMPRCALFNSYGPAETTMVVMNWRVEKRPQLQEISLGSVQQNSFALVEERRRSVSAKGTRIYGELLIAGVQVAKGYVGCDPVGSFTVRTIAGEKREVYATGDMVRLDVETGLLYFVGREDNLVKVNGVRINLDEIENTIRAVPSVQACAAYVTTSDRRPQLRVAYKSARNKPIAAEIMRTACALHLSPFSMPSFFKQIEAMPLTASGKIDRRMLAALDACEEGHGAASGPRATTTQTAPIAAP